MRLRPILILALASLLPALSADGREVVLGIQQSLTADSNLFNESQDPTADGSYRIGPTIRLREQRDVLNFDFFYTPQYQVYMRTDNVNGLNHTFIGELEYRPTPRDTITLSSSAILRRAVQLLTDPNLVVSDFDTPGIGDTGRYIVDLRYQRRLTDRLAGSVSGRYEQWTYTNGTAVPNISGTAKADTYWAFTPEIQAGIEVTGSYRAFEAIGSLPPSTNAIGNASLFGAWQIDPRWSMTLSGGPAYVAQRQDAPEARLTRRFRTDENQNGVVAAAQFANCLPFAGLLLLERCLINGADPSSNLADPFQEVFVDFPPGTETTSTNSDFATFFAGAEVRYEFPRGFATLGYSRNQDATGGVGSTNITDAVTGRAAYDLNRRTNFSLLAVWSKRKSELSQSQGFVTAVQSSELSDNNQPLAEAGDLALIRFNSERDLDQVRVVATVLHRLSKNLQVRGQFNFTTQRIESIAIDPVTDARIESGSRRTNRYIGRVFIRYEFDPYRF